MFAKPGVSRLNAQQCGVDGRTASLLQRSILSSLSASAQVMDPEVYQGMRNPNFWTAPGVIVVLAWLVLSVVVPWLCLWRVFTKSGRPGWAALVPIYNLVVLVKIVGKPAWWAALLAIPFVQWPVVWVMVMLRLARSFGKGIGFGLGLCLGGFIFFPLLAFSGARFHPMEQAAA